MSARVPVKRRLLHAAIAVGEAALATAGIERPRALLILGHMRSGSTLLLHVLLTDPEISGIGERNARYDSEKDLARLVLATRIAGRGPLARVRYVADQINHDEFTPDPRLFAHERVRVLFLIRDPLATVSSLLDLTRTHYEPWSVGRAVDYYVGRLATLARFGSGLVPEEHRAGFVTYGDLTAHPTETLPRLQAFLGTRHGFSERYPSHAFTGKRGDPSDNIRTGRIGAARDIEQAVLSPADVARANDAYANCLRALAPFALRPAGDAA